ncbi:hypothetical protein BGZ63DRAFT_459133 [Mariannaea sp. PMI_226]|nr:hypothetical protein BGZ63DRAFT_459133 [Mariannaea sp. PMI_226]
MALCKFYQQGYCRNGNNCRFEHAGATTSNANRNQPASRFSPLGGLNASQDPAGMMISIPQPRITPAFARRERKPPQISHPIPSNTMLEKYHITADVIERDLTSETPQWILSSYAPGRDAPGQLFGGYPREQSFEEMRLHFYAGKAAGNEQQALWVKANLFLPQLNDAQQLYSNAQQQLQNAAANTRDAIQFIISAENNHPNRLDICQQGTQGAPFGEFVVGRRPKSLVPSLPAQSNPFGSNNATSAFGGGASTTQPSAFGQPSALGQKPNPFGTPSFGQPSQPSQPTSAFGQPSQPASAFGQPSQPASAFGQPSQPASAFGQPSALGAKPSPFGAPSFGTPSQPANQGSAGSAFGQPSQLGQKPNPFGASSTNNNDTPLSPFSSAGNNTNASPFASAGASNNAPSSSPFGAPSGQNQGSGPFASNNNQNQNMNGTSPFGQPSQASSPFAQAQATPAASNPFASTNQGPSAANNPFAQAQQQQPNGFTSQQNQQQTNPFGQASNAAPAAPIAAKPSGNPYPPGSSKQHPAIESYSAKDMTGRLTMFAGKPVTYKDDKPGIRQFDGVWRRIWFPDGPPGYSKDTELPAGEYTDKSKIQWTAFQQSGTFQDGLMPELPPPRECTMWNF